MKRLSLRAIPAIATIVLLSLTALEIAALRTLPRTQQERGNAEQTVYVTRTGKKYHAAGCRYLSRSQFPMKLKNAINAGYTPCSVCNPPTLRESGRSEAQPEGQKGSDTGQRATKTDTPAGETTATGKPIYVGPRGGRYHYSKSGRKVYERRRR